VIGVRIESNNREIQNLMDYKVCNAGPKAGPVCANDSICKGMNTCAEAAQANQISGTAHDRAGWVGVSFFDKSGSTPTRFADELAMVKMRNVSGTAPKTCERWAIHHNSEGSFQNEAHGVWSADGLRTVFGSAWSRYCSGTCGTSGGNVYAFVVDTR